MCEVQGVVLQGTKLGPWLFIIMINNLDIPGFELWKYDDDSTNIVNSKYHLSSRKLIQ